MEILKLNIFRSEQDKSAAAHLAAGKGIITRADLDGSLLCREDPYDGGPVYDGSRIIMNDTYGYRRSSGISIAKPIMVRVCLTGSQKAAFKYTLFNKGN